MAAVHQHPGRNRLELTLARGAVRPREMEISPRFGLAALRVVRDTPAPPVPLVRDGRLVLPADTAADVFLRVPTAGRLVLQRAAAGGPLEVVVTTDGASPRHLGRIGDAASHRLDLTPEAGALARITLRAGDSAVALARAQVETTTGGREAPAPPPPIERTATNVVLYVADTLRADRLGAYGYARPTSPHLDALAREGVLFEDAVAQGPWTRPTVASILTGRLPPEHRAVSLMDAIRADVPTLAELLGGAGYATAAFVTNLNVGARFGFGRGFATFEELREDRARPTVYATAADLNARALPWLEAHRDRPFFLYLHASDPHAPYHPDPTVAAPLLPPGIGATAAAGGKLRDALDDPNALGADELAALSALYDGDVATLDAGFGELRAALARLGLDDSTLIVFVADHGEEFLDHGGLEHGRTLFQELVRVPLLVRLPGGRGGGRRVPDRARQVDVFATILALAGIPPPPGIAGEVLLAADGTPRAGAREAFSHVNMRAERGRELVAWTTGDWKLVVDRSRGSEQLFDLARDGGERHDRAAEHPIVAGYARQAALRVLAAARAAAADTRVVDPDLERRLRALGYVAADGE
jgi:arylsulfatase A-like enzyme